MAASLYRLGSLCSRKSIAALRPRLLHTSSTQFAAYDAEFKQAKERLSSLRNDPGNQVKLQMYGLFKQATVGSCNTPKPGMMDFVGKAKWEAWSNLGAMSQDDAQREYISVVESLVAAEGGSAGESTDATTGDEAAARSGDIEVVNRDGMCVISFNRPDKKNAITRDMYKSLIDILQAADKDDAVTIAVVTGKGDFYSSGNDLSSFTAIDPKDYAAEAEKGGDEMSNMVDAFINFNKPIIGLVNGPALGIAVTTLGLMDVVYCSDNATFQTPFSALGQAPEGCSSYIFPKIMGSAKANEMLMFNKRISAGEALERNLVAAVFPSASFQKEAWTLVEGYAKLPKKSLSQIKTINRDAERETLIKVNWAERKVLVERWQSEECLNAVISFFSKGEKI